MSTMRGAEPSKLYTGLLPVVPSEEFVRPAGRKNDGLLNRRPPLRKRALRALAHFLITFCIILAAILAWRSYSDTARRAIANSYSQFGWLAPRGDLTVQKTPDTIALAASPASYPSQQQLDAILRDLHAIRQSIDRMAAGQEKMTHSIDQIATSIAVIQGQTTRSTDQTATSQEQAPSAKASITVEGRADGASLQPTAHLGVEPTDARLPETLSERGKQLSVASPHVRPRAREHRSEMVQGKGTVGTTEKELAAPPAPYKRAPE